MLDYHADSDVRVYKGVQPDADGYYNGDVFYFSVEGDSPTTLDDLADILDKMSEDEILVVFNDVPELTYEVWDRYKVGYHDYDVHHYEIGLKK